MTHFTIISVGEPLFCAAVSNCLLLNVLRALSVKPSLCLLPLSPLHHIFAFRNFCGVFSGFLSKISDALLWNLGNLLKNVVITTFFSFLVILSIESRLFRFYTILPTEIRPFTDGVVPDDQSWVIEPLSLPMKTVFHVFIDFY